MHARYDIDVVDDNPLALRSTQGDVENGTVFGDVDLIAAKHRADARGQSALACKRQQQLDGFVDDAILRLIEVEVCGIGRESLAAPGIIGEKLS